MDTIHVKVRYPLDKATVLTLTYVHTVHTCDQTSFRVSISIITL